MLYEFVSFDWMGYLTGALLVDGESCFRSFTIFSGYKNLFYLKAIGIDFFSS
jgi:hypothetical protein